MMLFIGKLLDSVTSAPQCIRQPRPRVYLKEGTYHTRLFRGPVILDGLAEVTPALVCLPRLDLAATEGKGAGMGGRATVRHLRECLSVCVYVCMCTRAHVHRCTSHALTHSFCTFVYVCAFVVDDRP